jgi:hypothetical protein
MHIGFEWESQKERDHYKFLYVERKVLIKYVFEKLDDMDCMWLEVETTGVLLRTWE